MENRKKKKGKGAVYYILLLLFLGVFSVSAYKVGSYMFDAYTNRQSVKEVSAGAVLKTPEKAQQIIVYREKKDPVTGTTYADKEEPGFVLPQTVDIAALKEKNSEIVGWICCPGTKIDYPVVKASDNEKYLHMLTNGAYASGGTLFMDCNDSEDLSGFKTVIYGHNMNNGDMFGTIDNYRRQEYYDEHPVLYYFNEEGIWLLEPCTGFTVDAESFVYGAVETEEQKKSFVSQTSRLSTFKSGTQMTVDDRYMVLSTCAYEFDNARYVLICRISKVVL